jgi:predicted nucleic acid-binding protein
MIVVADTTPLNYLILIGEIEILPRLYGRVIIPPAVQSELAHEAAPPAVRMWAEEGRPWLEVLVPAMTMDPELKGLDAGEREAIALAEQISACQLIIDERSGRRAAERRGLSVIGTLGVLRAAADEGLLNLQSTIEKLRGTSFHISPEVLGRLLENR